MPGNYWGEHLAAASREVLETMFFACVGEHAEPSAEAQVRAALWFRGEPCGRLTLAVSGEVAAALAASFLGDPEEVRETDVQDVVCELANMVCGSALSRIAPQSLFELSRPEPLAGDPEFGAAAVRRSLEVDGGTLSVSFEVQPWPWPTAEKSVS